MGWEVRKNECSKLIKKYKQRAKKLPMVASEGLKSQKFYGKTKKAKSKSILMISVKIQGKYLNI